MLQQCPLTSLCCSLSQWQCSKADECARHAAFGNARFCLHRFANMNNCVYDNAWACMLTASLEHLMRILKRHLVSKNTNSAIMPVWSVEGRGKIGVWRRNRCVEASLPYGLMFLRPSAVHFITWQGEAGASSSPKSFFCSSFKCNSVTDSRHKATAKWHWSGCQSASFSASPVMFGKWVRL